MKYKCAFCETSIEPTCYQRSAIKRNQNIYCSKPCRIGWWNHERPDRNTGRKYIIETHSRDDYINCKNYDDCLDKASKKTYGKMKCPCDRYENKKDNWMKSSAQFSGLPNQI